MKFNDLSLKIEQELTAAERFRQEGNEGRSRVCARLAAGYAVKDYLSQQKFLNIPKSTYQTLIVASTLSTLPESARKSLRLLTLRVNEDHHLPPGVDLIQEASNLISILESLDE